MSAKVVAITGGAQGIGRAIGVPDDIAKACLFLAESAAFMTGQNITIDGGMTVKMIYV